jgi:hypothetical protein
VNTDSTVGHGLGKAPDLIIIKKLTFAKNWEVYSAPTGGDNGLFLNTSTPSAPTNAWSSTAPTGNVFTYGNEWGDYIAYCFANTEMLQVGSYTGNGLDDGPMINLPMKPAFILIKCTEQDGASWAMFDNARNPFNVVDKALFADGDWTETSRNHLDFLSNGAKIRTANNSVNYLSKNHIYLAISEQSFKHSRGR